MRRPRAGFAAWLALAVVVFAGLIALGVWQVHRLAWKEALIARVNARVSAPPVPAPGPARWARVTAKNSGYRHVSAVGHYETGRDTFVKAVTVNGPGFWLLTPLDTRRGFTLLVNRGFVDQARAKSDSPPPTGSRIVTGLLRLTEPGGAFLRSNDPAANRWYSRDVAAIARTRHLSHVAPYFIDADAHSEPAGEPAGGPIGGLTVIRFPNNHLSYAITWFALAALVAFGAGLLIRERFRSHKE